METSEKHKSGWLKGLSDGDLNYYMSRSTGKTTRMIDNLIQEFFTRPMGTKIYVVDHYGTKQANKMLLDLVRTRIENEHKVKYHVGLESAGFYIVRDEQTLKEMVLEELNRRRG